MLCASNITLHQAWPGIILESSGLLFLKRFPAAPANIATPFFAELEIVRLMGIYETKPKVCVLMIIVFS